MEDHIELPELVEQTANMLERLLAQLDPMYRAFPFGRVVIDESVPDSEVRFVQDGRTVARITNVGA